MRTSRAAETAHNEVLGCNFVEFCPNLSDPGRAIRNFRDI